MKTITLEQLKDFKRGLQNEIEVSRGEIWVINIPKELKKFLGENVQVGERPCVIISGEGNNDNANTVNILPISSQLHKGKIYPQHALINRIEDVKACGLDVPSFVATEQYLTFGKDKLIEKLGKAPQHLMKMIDEKQQVQQGLNSRCYFNWNNAFKQLKLILKMRKVDHETYSYLCEQLQNNCEKYNVDINIVLSKYKSYYANENKERKVNLYESKYKLNRNLKPNMVFSNKCAFVNA